MAIKEFLITAGRPVESIRERVSKYPLSWRVGVAFFLIMTILSVVPFAIGQMEYYQLYELQGQGIKVVRDGGQVYEDVLVMDLVPYAYGDGTYKLHTKKNLIGGVIGVNVDNMAPSLNAITGEPSHLYFAEENELRHDLDDGEMVVVRWAWGIGGYHVKGVMPLSAYDNSEFVKKLETNPNDVQAQKYVVEEIIDES